MDNNQPLYFSYSTPSTEVFDPIDLMECIVCQCNPCQCNPCQCNPCQCTTCCETSLLQFKPITVEECDVEGNCDECNTQTIGSMDDTIENAYGNGLNHEFIIIGDKKIFKRLTIPFYCYSDDPVTYEQLSATLPNYIVTYSQENYYTIDVVQAVDDHIIFTLSFFSDSGLNFVGFSNSLNDSKLRNYYYQCNVICKTRNKAEEQVFLMRRQGFDTLFNTPYLWERNELKLKELEYDDEGNIVSYGDKFEEAFTFPTFHKYSNDKCFQPLLGDVFNQIPWDCQLDGPFLITTEMISNDPELIIRGDYHVGKTTIYTPVPGQNNKRRKLDPEPCYESF